MGSQTCSAAGKLNDLDADEQAIFVNRLTARQ
ncbi:hypothetical protein [Escherichia coli]